MSTYPLISSDSHIIEPPDLWTQRIDRAFTARAPRLIHEAEADQWYNWLRVLLIDLTS